MRSIDLQIPLETVKLPPLTGENLKKLVNGKAIKGETTMEMELEVYELNLKINSRIVFELSLADIGFNVIRQIIDDAEREQNEKNQAEQDSGDSSALPR